MLRLGNNLELLKDLETNSIDSCVCDPPYGLKFMSKKWDYSVPSVALWTEVLRVLKPGAHLLAFGGTRTYHRLAVNIEDAGFKIRDQIQWLYGSGFPKSYNIGKNTEGWNGWGTALKPANEPIVMARKPLSEKTIVDNVLKWGTGGINVDGCRVPSQGRFPANLILDETAAEMLDEQSGPCKTGALTGQPRVENKIYGKAGATLGTPRFYTPDAATGASRFFYVAKSSKRERGDGNNHPTVKPIKLMEYLVRLVTPQDGICLDPFMGSGTTGIGCKNQGFEFIGMEIDKEYMEIAKRRIK